MSARKLYEPTRVSVPPDNEDVAVALSSIPPAMSKVREAAQALQRESEEFIAEIKQTRSQSGTRLKAMRVARLTLGGKPHP